MHGMDYFRTLLSEVYHGRKRVYYASGNEATLQDIASTPFGDVCNMLDGGVYCEKGEDKKLGRMVDNSVQ